MQNKNIWLLFISTLILVFDIIMGFILSLYSVEIINTDSKILYICIKLIALVLLIAIIALSFRKKDTANYLVQYISTLILQFVPLIVRYLSVVKNGFLISLIITFVALIIYFSIIIGFSVLSKKTIIASKNLEGKTIPVKEDINENGKNV